LRGVVRVASVRVLFVVGVSFLVVAVVMAVAVMFMAVGVMFSAGTLG
jgi:hypothetical protein